MPLLQRRMTFAHLFLGAALLPVGPLPKAGNSAASCFTFFFLFLMEGLCGATSIGRDMGEEEAIPMNRPLHPTVSWLPCSCTKQAPAQGVWIACLPHASAGAGAGAAAQSSHESPKEIEKEKQLVTELPAL